MDMPLPNNKTRLVGGFFLTLFFLIALYYRLKGLNLNTPFWIDEFATADQARLLTKFGLASFFNPNIFIEHHNITTYALVALFFSFFGMSEASARLPFVFIGSLVPIATYVAARKFFDTTTALSATLFTIFSYFLITWSRQARGYMLLQFLILCALYCYVCFIKDQKKYCLVLFMIVSFLGILTHSFYYLFILALAIHFFLFSAKNRSYLTRIVRSYWFYIGLAVLIIFNVKIGMITALVTFFKNEDIGFNNNIWYYHSFLWREYGTITLLAILGSLFVIKEKKILGFLIIVYLAAHLLFISAIFGHYISKYLLPIFPLYFMLAAYAITSIGKTFKSAFDKHSLSLAAIGITFFIILNGNLFTIKPRSFYSVNHVFREIALIDYNAVYEIVRDEVAKNRGSVAMIDTWPARSHWYLGQDFQPLYILRWKGEAKNLRITGQTINRTPFIRDNQGNKIVPKSRGLRLVEDKADLLKVTQHFTKGFIFIDDETLPQDVINYAQKNFKKELYLDHYVLDDNPYSIWPATLYSWGI